jgi:hypothetical protein
MQAAGIMEPQRDTPHSNDAGNLIEGTKRLYKISDPALKLLFLQEGLEVVRRCTK